LSVVCFYYKLLKFCHQNNLTGLWLKAIIVVELMIIKFTSKGRVQIL
jgi:hypothetical protein